MSATITFIEDTKSYAVSNPFTMTTVFCASIWQALTHCRNLGIRYTIEV